MSKVGIYKVTNPIGQVYIGQSVDLKARMVSTLSGASSLKLKESMRLYGINNHSVEILEECPFVELNRKERFYQMKFNSHINGLNTNLTSDKDKSLPSTKKVMLLYGEKTVQVNYRIPASKKEEIHNRFSDILNEYINVQRVEVSINNGSSEKSNPADSVYEPVAIEYVEPIEDPAILNRMFATDPIIGDSVVIESGIVQADYVETKPLEEKYNCVEVDRGIPAEEDRIYHGVRTKIAFWDKDDPSVFYVFWDGKHYRFVNQAVFKQFLANNNIR